jgi:hypothetical protein
MVRVDEVDAGRGDADEEVAGSGFRPGRFPPLQDLGTAVLSDDDCVHGFAHKYSSRRRGEPRSSWPVSLSAEQVQASFLPPAGESGEAGRGDEQRSR